MSRKLEYYEEETGVLGGEMLSVKRGTGEFKEEDTWRHCFNFIFLTEEEGS